MNEIVKGIMDANVNGIVKTYDTLDKCLIGIVSVYPNDVAYSADNKQFKVESDLGTIYLDTDTNQVIVSIVVDNNVITRIIFSTDTGNSTIIVGGVFNDREKESEIYKFFTRVAMFVKYPPVDNEVETEELNEDNTIDVEVVSDNTEEVSETKE